MIYKIFLLLCVIFVCFFKHTWVRNITIGDKPQKMYITYRGIFWALFNKGVVLQIKSKKE